MLWSAFLWEVEEGSIVVYCLGDLVSWTRVRFLPHSCILVHVNQVKAGTSALETPPPFTLKPEHE